MPDFSYEAFEELLRFVGRAGYTFCRFDRPPPVPGRAFFLRFDVDISPLSAQRMGRIAQDQGVSANFLFQLNAETYNIFSPRCRAIMAELRAQGHGVGLHIDQTLFGEDEATIAGTIDWFRTCVADIDNFISFHRPTPAVLGRTYERFISGYDASHFGPERYLSDSRRSLEFWPRLQSWLEEGRTPLQLLLHPIWWYPHESAEAIWQDLQARRVNELEHYMVENFRKVFTGVVQPSERDFSV